MSELEGSVLGTFPMYQSHNMQRACASVANKWRMVKIKLRHPLSSYIIALLLHMSHILVSDS